MRIWKKPATIAQINQVSKGCLVGQLDIEIVELGDDFLKASMPVAPKTHQPMGVLHGGASVVLAETIGSIAANLAVGPESYCVGMEVNANHLRSVQEGLVIGTGRPLHLGKRTQVWDIEIVDEEHNRVCVSRLTLAVLPFQGTQIDLFKD